MDDGERTKSERDREWVEFLNELRVALPGVQVLFAFLLTVAFTQRFQEVTQVQKIAYFTTFLCTAAASVLLMAPTAYHRLRWRRRDKERTLVLTNRLAIAGTVFLALAMVGAIFLIVDLLFDLVTTVAVTAGAAVVIAWFWYGLALARRARRDGA